MYRHDILLTEYVELYEEMGSRVDLQNILQANIERGVVRDEQRAIWKTWRISVESWQVLNVMALFGQYEIRKALLREVVDCVRSKTKTDSIVAYTNWVKGELVNEASMVQANRVNESESYNIHPLIPQFVASDVSKTNDAQIYGFKLVGKLFIHMWTWNGPLKFVHVIEFFASVKEKLGSLGEAEEMYRECLAMLHRLLGEETDHEDIAFTMNRLASIKWRQGSLVRCRGDAREMSANATSIVW